MDSFINAGKKFLAENAGGNNNNGNNNNNNNNNENNYSGNNNNNNNNNNHQSGGSSDLFSSVFNSITNKEDELKQGDVDEQAAAEHHDQVYNKGDNNTSVNAMGTAAAMQALKKFTSGGQQQESGGKQDFLSLAMGEASKLFDNKSSEGSVANGADKQSVMQKAGEVAMKLYFKNQMQQSGGGIGGLANMASKFLK